MRCSRQPSAYVEPRERGCVFRGVRPFRRADVPKHREHALVYAFYDANFSFKEVITRQPEAADQITDCLSGDVNKDFSQLWSWIREFVPLPEELPYAELLVE